MDEKPMFEKEVESVQSGYTYSIYEGCVPKDGEAQKGTADKVDAGWAPTREQAEEAAEEALEELRDDDSPWSS